MKKILLLSFLFAATMLSAQKPVELPLWPNGAPNNNELTNSGQNHKNTITALGRLLEISMNKVNDVLPIEEELENIKSYIKIQQVRYPGRFDVAYHIEEGILKEHTLKLILQPLVENSILHNIEARDFLMIDISGRCENGIMLLRALQPSTPEE